MLERVISGGQLGTDQAALRAARRAGIPTGGWAPRGWITEAGPAPWLAEYGLVECPDGDTEPERYRARRRRCVRECHAVLVFGDIRSPGSRGLVSDCRALARLWISVKPGLTTPRQIIAWLAETPHVTVLMVGGNRESREPGIGERVERFLLVVFRSLARMQRPRD